MRRRQSGAGAFAHRFPDTGPWGVFMSRRSRLVNLHRIKGGFAAGEVRVALSGLGGDELFLGYDVYRHLWPGRLLVDGPAARPAAALAGAADALAGLLARAAGPRAEVPRRALELAASGGDPLRYWATLRNGWDLGPAVARELYAPAWRRRIW